jgi:hypothetical protein
MEVDVPLISSLASIMSRLSYFNNDEFLDKYIEIFSIPELHKQLSVLKNTTTKDIFNIQYNNTIELNKKINKIILKKHTVTNKTSENVKYISISTSNYSTIYVVANKTMNTIFICLRGTSSLKSATSYLKFSSIAPVIVCDKTKDGYLIGIYKIIQEIFYTIYESIQYLALHFLQNKSYKIILTGHSLGGGGAIILSYLLVKYNPMLKVTCITFGSPRVMNYYVIQKYNKLIDDKKIFFRRYITNGDPITMLPITKKTKDFSYYFPDDVDNSRLDYTAITCSSSANVIKTRKFVCGVYNKTKKNKPNFKYHGLYLGIIFKYSINKKNIIDKEIQRNNYGQTICRIIVGGDNKKSRYSFYNLDEAKSSAESYWLNIKLQKIKKKIFIDYKKQDIYITTEMFKKIIDNGYEVDDEKANILSSNTYIPIDHSEKTKHKNINCV